MTFETMTCKLVYNQPLFDFFVLVVLPATDGYLKATLNKVLLFLSVAGGAFGTEVFINNNLPIYIIYINIVYT